MTSYSDASHNDASDRSRQWITCIAKADFAGDARCTQLSFRKNDRLEIDLRLPPQNGWRWGRTEFGKGWFPEWAADPLSALVRPSSSEHQNHQPSLFYRNRNNNDNDKYHSGFGRPRGCVTPLGNIYENPLHDLRMIQRPKQESSHDSNGFDLGNNQIMGGRNPTTASTTSNDSDGQRKRQLTSEKNNHGSLKGKDPFAIMAKSENPYTRDQREPEWDGSEVPQIVNNVNGSITVLETDGRASSYRDERSYRLADATNRMANKLSSTGKALESKVFSGFRMPAVHKPRIDYDNDNDRVSRRRDAGTISSTTTAARQRILPKMPTFSKPRFGVKSRPHEEREETIVDDRRRSSRSRRLNIGF